MSFENNRIGFYRLSATAFFSTAISQSFLYPFDVLRYRFQSNYIIFIFSNQFKKIY